MNQKLCFNQSLFLAILLLTSTYALGQVNLNNGLVGYFPFNGNANDESSININGSVNNAILTAGIYDDLENAYYFNGIDANIDCSPNERNISDTVTVSAWIKTTTSDYVWIAGKYDWTIDKGFHLSISNNKPFVAGRNDGGEYVFAHSSKLINDGEWHHVMGVVYHNTWEIWVDCQLDSIVYSDASSPDLTNSEPMTIGNYNMGQEGEHYHFLGAIDEIRVYNRLLTEEEKQLLCNAIQTETHSIMNTKDVNIYPNPANNFVSIVADGVTLDKIELFDISGISLKKYESTNLIDISDLNAGIYLIKIFDAEGTIIKTDKIIKIN